jgi:RNA polymerase sigma-70 factor (ECF subfamily)
MVSDNTKFFNELYLKWYGGLIKYAYRLTSDKGLAEEIVQDAFVEAYKKVELLQQHDNPTGWLYVATRNISRAKLRDKKKRQYVVKIEKDLLFPRSRGDNIDYYISDYLTTSESDIIIRFYKHRQPISQIAKVYGISESACKMRLKRSREKIKRGHKKNFQKM